MNKKQSLCFSQIEKKLKKLDLPKLNGIKLKLADNVKFLGLILDQKLSWKYHIEERINKATRIYWQCRVAFGKTWGLKPKVIHWLFTSIIRPILCYGCHLWYHKAKVNKTKLSVEHVQRMAMLGITGVMKSTPTKSLETILSILPIDLYVEQEAMATAIRLKNANCWKDSIFGHAAIIQSYEESIPELLMHTNKCNPEYYFDKNYNVTIPHRTEWQNEYLCESDSMNIFTDGSKMEEGTGIGIFATNPTINVSQPMDTYATITQAEIYAIKEACDTLNESNTSNHNINICSDSQASLKALNGHCFTSKLAIECRNSLMNLSASNVVNLIWVPVT